MREIRSFGSGGEVACKPLPLPNRVPTMNTNYGRGTATELAFFTARRYLPAHVDD